jgi:hypothetical protein
MSGRAGGAVTGAAAAGDGGRAAASLAPALTPGSSTRGRLSGPLRPLGPGDDGPLTCCDGSVGCESGGRGGVTNTGAPPRGAASGTGTASAGSASGRPVTAGIRSTAGRASPGGTAASCSSGGCRPVRTMSARGHARSRTAAASSACRACRLVVRKRRLRGGRARSASVAKASASTSSGSISTAGALSVTPAWLAAARAPVFGALAAAGSMATTSTVSRSSAVGGQDSPLGIVWTRASAGAAGVVPRDALPMAWRCPVESGRRISSSHDTLQGHAPQAQPGACGFSLWHRYGRQAHDSGRARGRSGVTAVTADPRGSVVPDGGSGSRPVRREGTTSGATSGSMLRLRPPFA